MSRWRALLRPEDLIPRDRNERLLSLAYIVNTIGNGLLITVSAVYFTRIVGLSATELGLGFSIAAGFGLVAGVSMGRVADTREVRSLTVLLMFGAGVFDVGLAFVDSFAWFVLCNVMISVFDRASNTTRAVVLSRLGGPEGRVRIRAYVRSLVNLGISLGTAIAGFVLAADNATVYKVVIVINGLTSIAASIAFSYLPKFEPMPEARDYRRTYALRDTNFVALTMLNAFSSLHYHVVDIALPLWILNFTSAPIWVLSVLMVLNTVAVVIFQVRFAVGAETVSGAAHLARRGAFWLFAGIVGYSLASYFDSAWMATAVLIVASVVHVVGELNQASAAFGIAYGVAPEALQGQYQAVWSLGNGLGGMVGPVILTTLCLGWGVPGWFVFGTLLFTAGAVVPVLISRREVRDGQAT